jgi:hypothetical protein
MTVELEKYEAMSTDERLAIIDRKLDYVVEFVTNIQSAMVAMQDNPMLRVLLRNAGVLDADSS